MFNEASRKLMKMFDVDNDLKVSNVEFTYGIETGMRSCCGAGCPFTSDCNGVAADVFSLKLPGEGNVYISVAR